MWRDHKKESLNKSVTFPKVEERKSRGGSKELRNLEKAEGILDGQPGQTLLPIHGQASWTCQYPTSLPRTLTLLLGSASALESVTFWAPTC